MAKVVTMPRQGNSTESCVLIGWRAEEGQQIGATDIICEIETEKAVFEVPAGVGGILLKRLADEGDAVPVFAPIAVIGEAGERWEAAVEGAMHHGDVTGRRHAGPGKPPSGVSPRARALASRSDFDPANLAGSGPRGRVIERDVRAAIGTGVSPGADPDPARGRLPFPNAVSSDIPLRDIRKAVADRVRDSLQTTAQYTLHAFAPATRLLALRNRMKASPGATEISDATIGELVLFAVSRALKAHPLCNAHKLGDVVRVFKRVHLGIAVDTPRGLMVPVLRNADQLGLEDISREVRRLAGACVGGRASQAELSGSTFTVSNLGAFGVDYFTPVLNAPEVCVLGVGAILPKPFAAADGQVGFAPGLALSLTADHQVVDGAPGARLLRDIGAAIADIDRLIVE